MKGGLLQILSLVNTRNGNPTTISVARPRFLTHTDLMKAAECLANHFLIAMPSLRNDIFEQGVIYLYTHSEKGAMGVLINKSLQITLGNLLQHLDVEVKDEALANLSVLTGGPVGPEQGLVIHDQIDRPADKDRSVIISSSKEMLRDIGRGKGPDNFLIVLGYSGWEGGQLEKEIKRNDWLVAPFSHKITFEMPLENRWRAAAKLIGVDINRLSGQIGHA